MRRRGNICVNTSPAARASSFDDCPSEKVAKSEIRPSLETVIMKPAPPSGQDDHVEPRVYARLGAAGLLPPSTEQERKEITDADVDLYQEQSVRPPPYPCPTDDL